MGASGDLLAIARERLSSGQLPPCDPVRLHAGVGTGRCCALCDRAIPKNEVEYEVEVTSHGTACWSFHIGCYDAWRDVCDDLSPQTPDLAPA